MDQALLSEAAPNPPQTPAQPSRRTIDTAVLEEFCCNKIITAKYTFYNFLPKNLFEQFHKVANVYFLGLAIMVCFPSVSPYSNIYSTIAPISLVLAFSALKDGYADWKRHIDDRATNQSQTHVIRYHQGQPVIIEQIAWSDVRVGDIVRVDEDENVPADMVLLSVGAARGDRRTEDLHQLEAADESPRSVSSVGSVKQEHEQICHVDSCNLDGESDLKIFRCHQQTAVADTPEQLALLQLKINIDSPHGDLYTTQGWMTVNGGDKLTLDESQLLLRGHCIRNTGLAWGVIVYTGHETKIMKNNERELVNKVTQVEHAMNKQLLFIFGGLFSICSAASIGSAHFTCQNHDSAWYLGLETNNDFATSYKFSSSFATNWYGTVNCYLVGFMSFLTFIMLFSNMVPISLYVTTEFLKLCFGQFITWDAQMVSSVTGRGATCRNVNIPEELGQVACVLSDKTGTLTCNQMSLLRLSVAGHMFGKGYSEIERSEAALGGQRLEPFEREYFDWENREVLFWDPTVSGYRWLDHHQSEELQSMLEALALCHTAVPCDADNDGTVTYNVKSPDDGALVLGAANLGMRLCSRRLLSGGKEQVMLEAVERDTDAGHTGPKLSGSHQPAVGEGCKAESVAAALPSVKHRQLEYTVLETIDFTSDRKRMSVVVRRSEAEGGGLMIICKGADTVMATLLADTQDPAAVSAQAHANEFADNGLRTLVVARKELSTEQFSKWRQQYRDAKEANDDEAKDALEKELESGLYVLGATAIEDKLQEDVAQTLEQLRAAHIRTWVLTGDKQETAIKIGQACKLLVLEQSEEMMQRSGLHSEDVMDLMVLELPAQRMSLDRSVPVLSTNYEVDDLEGLKVQMNQLKHSLSNGAWRHALVVSGPTLMLLGIGWDAKTTSALTEERFGQYADAQLQFVQLASECEAVLCCRVSPSQKADLTKLVKLHTNEVSFFYLSDL